MKEVQEKSKAELFEKAYMSFPPQYEEMKKLLSEGFDINSQVDDCTEGKSHLTNILTERFWNIKDTDENDPAEYLRLSMFFMDNGFDVKKYGGECLHALCFAPAEEYVLPIAERLLDMGADIYTKYEEDESDEGVLETIEWQLGEWVVGNARYADIMSAYYEMVEAYKNGGRVPWNQSL